METSEQSYHQSVIVLSPRKRKAIPDFTRSPLRCPFILQRFSFSAFQRFPNVPLVLLVLFFPGSSAVSCHYFSVSASQRFCVSQTSLWSFWSFWSLVLQPYPVTISAFRLLSVSAFPKRPFGPFGPFGPWSFS